MELNIVSFNIRCCDDENGNSINERAPRLFNVIKPIIYKSLYKSI